MSYHLSTKRQSNLEIRTHHRLLPRKVGTSSEQNQLIRKRNQLMAWIEQADHKCDQAHLLKMLEEYIKAHNLAIKFYSEKRRRRFDKIIRELRRKEDAYIKKIIRLKQQAENGEVVEDEDEHEETFLEYLTNGIKSMFCCFK
ncbi:hypothetical protein GCK72_022130 [Caenorhabditis remanei]|nr:hypothetical protein GCK72_022130 [Caenorhabditis remanei]KAF1745683.1 hypothetical protein GCK72_022130 [Caenorhabditis remanei]